MRHPVCHLYFLYNKNLLVLLSNPPCPRNSAHPSASTLTPLNSLKFYWSLTCLYMGESSAKEFAVHEEEEYRYYRGIRPLHAHAVLIKRGFLHKIQGLRYMDFCHPFLHVLGDVPNSSYSMPCYVMPCCQLTYGTQFVDCSDVFRK